MSHILHFLLEHQASILHPFSLIFLFLFLFVLKWFFNPSTSNKNLPPSPSKLPIIGNLHQLGLYPHHALRSLAHRHGPLMLLHFGSAPTLVVSSAELAQEVMKTHDLIFSNRPELSIARRVTYNYKDIGFAPYGEYWRQTRSICVLHLLSMKKVQSFRSVREEETALMIEKIKQYPCSSIDLSKMFNSLANDIICRVVLGRKYSEGGRSFKKLLEKLVEVLGVFNVGDFIPWLSWLNYVTGLNARVERVVREFDDFLDGVVDDHMAPGSGAASRGTGEGQMDFVDVLLEIQKDSKDGVSMGRDNIKAIVMEMFTGGTDTTYTALEWTMTELLRHPKAMKEVQKEIRGTAGGKPYITENDIEKMDYLKAIIKEALRLHPPTPLLLPRESTKDVKLNGYDISSKTRVIINAWAIGRDPAMYEEPEEFRPERFLNSSIDFKGHDFQLLPFGAGRRGCPGTTFATAVMEIVLANLLHKFDWSLPGGARGEDLDVTESTGITTHRKFPLLVIATPHTF